jgi:hypothetical protein
MPCLDYRNNIFQTSLNRNSNSFRNIQGVHIDLIKLSWQTSGCSLA